MSRLRSKGGILAVVALMVAAIGVAGAGEQGEMYASLMGASVSVQREFRRTLPSIFNYSQTAHMQNQSEAVGSGDAYASPAYYCSPTTMCSPNSNWVMWDTPFISNEKYKAKDGYRGYKQNSSGFATGISRLLGETTAIGLAVGYDYRKFDSRDDHNWRERADAFHAALYGGTAIGCFFVDGYLGYTRTWHRTERIVGRPEFGPGFDRNKGNFNDTILSAGLKASYVWILPSEFRITPAIGLDFSHVRQNGFSEKGWVEGSGAAAASALRVDKSNESFLQMPITVSVNKTYTSDFLTFGGKCSLWTPEVRAGWIPQFGGDRTDVGARYLNGGLPSFKSKSTDFGGSYGTVGAGVKIKLRDKYIFAVEYDYYFASKYSNHIVTASYGVSF